VYPPIPGHGYGYRGYRARVLANPYSTFTNRNAIPISRNTQQVSTKLLTWLPLPPDPADPYWDNRCFDCFAYGHMVDRCKGPIVCRACLNQGHPSRLCPSMKPLNNITTELRPRGNLGDSAYPTNRPDSITFFLHDNYAMLRLSEAYVVDAQFISNHSLPQLHISRKATIYSPSTHTSLISSSWPLQQSILHR
jgi:hypothetical protein